MRKIGILLTFIVWCGAIMAQQMSDEQVIKYVIEQRDKGVSQQQIISYLVKRGVTMEQINRIRNQYEKQENGAPVGNTVNEKRRTRTVPEKGTNLLYESQEERNKTLTTQERSLQIEEGMGFLMPQDTAQLVQQLLLQLAEQQKIPIFGHSIFQNKEVAFEPAINIPTPEDYRLGPGDEVLIDIWGASELSVQETISPDGDIPVENIGLVYLNGMTVKEANEYLKQELGKTYNDLLGDKPNSNIRLSLGQNRSIQVSVMGEVENPGTYTLSSFASVFHALYQSGGVNEIGSLRTVKVYRNNTEITTLDIYDYLLNGRIEQDVRLNDGDVVVVDTYDCLVNISGRVKRPMFYEMKPEETVATLMDYAGGYTKDAYRGDVRLIRMGQRERQIFSLNDAEQQTFKVMDGDSIAVDSIMITFENMVEIKGAVYRPGQFQVGGHINTVKDLIAAGGGLRGDAFVNRAILNRKKENLLLENLSIDVKGLMDGTVEDIPLRKNDVLFIPAISDIQEIRVVDIYGEVAFPGTYEFADNTTIEDLIILAGGLKDVASTAKVDVSRRKRDHKATQSSDSIAQVFSFEVKDGLIVDGAQQFFLEPFDAVYIRRSPGYYQQQNVKIQGEITFEGTYVLEKKNQRLSDIVRNAGGITKDAYPKGARLERRMTDEEKLRAQSLLDVIQRQQDSIDIKSLDIGNTYYVGIELDKALANPGSDADIVVQDGDRLIIPQLTNTVKIQGNVMYPNTVSFNEGKKLKYYIEQAGGYGTRAKSSKTFIVYMNGTVAKANKYSSELIQPGCEIVVPSKTDRKGMSTAEIMSLSSTSASLATVVLALINLFK